MPFVRKYWGIAVLVLALGGGVVWGLFSDPGVSKRTATAPAEIVSAEPIHWKEDGNLFAKRSRSISRSGYRVTYRFTANQQVVSAISDKNFWYEKGEQCRVCYEPAHPENNDLRDASSGAPCGSKFFSR